MASLREAQGSQVAAPDQSRAAGAGTGFVTSRAAADVGTTAQHGLLAMSVGDHVGNLVSPFWVVLVAGMARVDFRAFFGYGVVFALLWFALGVAIFTFVS